ncbi:MAG: hypothetical protein AAB317_01625 [Nitrospirota bacterium]
MQVTTKELRVQPGKIIAQVIHGKEITVTYRGKVMAKIVPVLTKRNHDDQTSDTIFGMWKGQVKGKSVAEAVRDLRKGRPF